MNERGSAQWLILLLVLAVPGAMFFYWYSNLNAESKRKLEAKVRNRMPGGVFSEPPKGDKFVNPIADSTTASTDTASGLQQSSGSVAGLTQDAVSPPSSDPSSIGSNSQLASDPLAALKALDTGAALAQASPAPAPVAGGIAIARDPTLSPYDLIRVEQLAFEKQLKAMEVLNAGKEAKEQNRQPKKVEPPIEDSIDLQGIVSTPDGGEKAIVNGEVVGEGEFVGAAKVLRITGSSVIFTHKGRRFSKAISK